MNVFQALTGMDNMSLYQIVISAISLLSPALIWALNIRIANTLMEFRERMKIDADKAYVNAPLYAMQLQSFEARFVALEKEQATQRERYHELSSKDRMTDQYQTTLLEEIRDGLKERR